ncbi:L-fuconolactonase [Ruegeria halocynthiae]|uniref:L-fuconolactonase n=1 Tax=Ruegeria halocynthiae TaxID=985054 RepID=A0A1H3BDW1_9RHOB|nr:amidohydrolase family protein [Ruegeria halocynthiae]SDX40096.1 L-fuconolactonase [Ruegeria halocynthiae]
MRIDAHQHFWTTARTDYGWLTPELGDIYRDFLPEDLEPLLSAAQIDATVLVQAAPTVAETEYLLTLAENTDFIKGVVGWVDFETQDAAATLGRLAKHPKFVGVRPMIQNIANPDWMLGKALTPAYEAIVSEDLTFDALTLPPHLANLSTLLSRHSEMRVVIDHGSKPYIRDGIFMGWAEDMAALARDTNCYCKLSGLVTEAIPEWSVDDLRPYVDHLLGAFGPTRLIWGSDWPVCTLACSYQRWCETTDDLLSPCDASEISAIMGGNAKRAYRLKI